MKYEELIEKHANEYKAYLTGYKDSLETLNQDRKKVLEEAKVTEANIPSGINNILNRDLEAWRSEWGMYGDRFKAMRINQQKEIDSHFDREKIKYRISKEVSDKTPKEKGKDQGR